MDHIEAIHDLAKAKIILDDEPTIRYWANNLKDYTGEEVHAGVQFIIDSGQSYVHLGLLTKAIKDVKARKFKEQQEQSQQEEHKSWKDNQGTMPAACKAAIDFLGIKNPTDEDRQAVVDAHRDGVAKHQPGTEMRRLWEKAAQTWEGVGK